MNVTTIGGATSDTFLITDEISITSTIDLTLIARSEKAELKRVIRQTGGGATNAAVAFSRLGLHTSCFCKVGIDADGILIKGTLAAENVDCRPIVTSSIFATGSSYIVHDITGHHLILVSRNANEHLTEEEIPYDHLMNSDFLYITSLSHNSADILNPICQFAKEHRIPIATNPGASQLAENSEALRDCLPLITLLILNFDEAKILANSLHLTLPKNLTKQDQLTLFFNAILAKGVKIAAVTDGPNGVYVAAQSSPILYHPSLPTNVIDTVGAGDAFGSVFAASYFENLPLQSCLMRGLLSSQSVISKIGAKPGLLTRQALNKLAGTK
jgi:sugar/nucleoside kinase (ribokinase family)